jgi:hypothetical protein
MARHHARKSTPDHCFEVARQPSQDTFLRSLIRSVGFRVRSQRSWITLSDVAAKDSVQVTRFGTRACSAGAITSKDDEHLRTDTIRLQAART